MLIIKVGNIEVYGIIYDIRNKINNKHYIGQTIEEKGFNGRYCRKGEGIKRFYSFHKALQKANRGNITSCLTGKNKTAEGYKWEYKIS